jgi:hypothetical protein
MAISTKNFVFLDVRHNSSKNELAVWEQMLLSASHRKDLPHLGFTL